MRLKSVETRHPLRYRFLRAVLTLKHRVRVPDVIRALCYRREFFGAPYDRWIQEILRGPSPWSVWERELMAAFTSRLNQCLF
jgi:hypothetical protein